MNTQKNKNLFFKFVCLVLVLCLAAGAAGCKDKSNGDNNVPTGNERRFTVNTDNPVGKIVGGGTSDYVIVIPIDYTETEYFAATEIQNFIAEATGVTLSVTLETAVDYSEETKMISVGGTAALDGIDDDVDYSALNGDGFIIRTDAQSVFINGANDRGTLYGAYDFLERYAGVKFIAADCTFVPAANEITLYETDIYDYPAFPLRLYLSGPLYSGDPLLLARMRMGGDLVMASDEYGGKVEWYTSIVHNTLSFVPTDVYFTNENREQNAHMYCLNDSGSPVDLCMTDGITADGKIDESMQVSAFKVALETLKSQVMKTSSNCNYFTFSQMDTLLCCECEDCVAAEAKYMRSGMNVRFTNLLAEEINKWSQEEYDGRTVNLVIFAYNYSTNPPVDSEGAPIDSSCVPNEYVYVRIAPINADNYYSFRHADKNKSFAQIFDGWASVTENIMVWSYHAYYTNFAQYYPTMQTFKENLSLYEEYGAEYVMMQGDHLNSADWLDRMNLYVASKMLWNPDRDVNALRNEYIDCYFGPVAEEVREVADRLDERLYEISLTGEVVFHIYHTTIMNASYYPITWLEGLIDILDGAIAELQESDDPNKDDYIRRVKEVKVTPLFMIVNNIDSYYSDSTLVYDTVKEFTDLTDEVGFTRYAEGGRGANDLRLEYGITD